MTGFVALLRAVNVGGTGKLPMHELKAICAVAGFAKARTYIASGNVVFECDASEAEVKKAIETPLHSYAGRSVGVFVRTAVEMARIVGDNPFQLAPANRTVAIFLDSPPPPDALDQATGQADEELRLGKREIYVHYRNGMAKSRLKIPAAVIGTARNLNTVAKLAEIVAAL